MLTKEGLLQVLDVEIFFHQEMLNKIKESKENISDYYRHERVLSAMKQIKSTIFNDKDTSETFNNIQELPLKEKVFEYLKTTKEFNGIDPFDKNTSKISRMNGLIAYIMSDGKQRNLSAITNEMNALYPEGQYTEHNVYRRMYALHNKGILVKQSMKGFYRLNI